MGVLFEFVRKANSIFIHHPVSRHDARDIMKALFRVDEILDLFEFAVTAPDQEVTELLRMRDQARNQGDFEQADTLRDQIEAMGFAIDDTVSGSRTQKNQGLKH